MKRNEQKVENTWKTEDIFKDAISIYLDDIEDIEVIKSNINLNPFKII